MGLYQHKNIREQTSEEIHETIQQRQSQRLLIALEAKTLREAKITKLSERDQLKYGKLGDKLVTKLAKIAVQLDACEADMRQMQVLSNQIDLFNEELGI